MEILWSIYVLVVVFSVDAVSAHRGSQGLFCVNDFVNNVSCTWNGSPPVFPGANCSIAGEMKINTMSRSCKLEQRGNSPPGCSLVFVGKEFHRFKDMPYIKMECDGVLVENLTNYKPWDHVKMHPPGVPNVSTTANETWISWSVCSPLSFLFQNSFDFQVQFTEKNQTWKEARTLFTQESKQRIPSQPKGHCQVRVRVCPHNWPNSHWSNWSPTTSWVGETDAVAPSQNQETSVLMRGLIFSLGLILVGMMVLYYRRCMRKGHHEKKPVPNPSKYFNTLHSVHGGDLKTWLNPLSAPVSFFTAQPCDDISPVELCEGSDGAPSTSPSSSSTSALLHFKSCPSTGSDTSGAVNNSSSSASSFFSNMGYFLTSSSGGSARTDPSPAYFTYQGDFHSLHVSLCPSIATTHYESLKREPQSPDSGFGMGKEDEEEKDDEMAVEREANDHQTSPLLILPLHPPLRMCPSSFPPPPPSPPGLAKVSSDSQQGDAPVAAASGVYTAWPLPGAMCRASSMPVEPYNTGYLTLKELQTTFSNKSI